MKIYSIVYDKKQMRECKVSKPPALNTRYQLLYFSNYVCILPLTAQICKHYEQALQERNDTGLQLIERNEEVCVFHERLNMQEAILRQADMDLLNRDEEKRYLQMEVASLCDSVH